MSEKSYMNNLDDVNGGAAFSSSDYINSFEAGTLCNDVWADLKKFNEEAKILIQNYVENNDMQEYNFGKARYVLKKNLNIELHNGKYLEAYVNNVVLV